jgi:hypothetical protein
MTIAQVASVRESVAQFPSSVSGRKVIVAFH